MGYKKDFVAGDKLLADELTENFTELEPVNEYVDPVPTFLTCAAAGALANFQAISDGAFNIIIDGVSRAITGLDLTGSEETVANEAASSGGWGIGSANQWWYSQKFTTGSDTTNIEKVRLNMKGVTSPDGNVVISIRADDGSNKPTGTDIESKTVSVACSSIGASLSYIDFEFSSAVAVSSNTTYHFVIRTTISTGNINMPSTGSAGGIADSSDSGVSWATKTDHFGYYVIGYEEKTFDNIADEIQTAIRALTSSTETVEYDTDHFVLSSADETSSSAITVLSAPSSGTDISGSSYLNGVTGAVTDYDEGSIDMVVKTDENGIVDKGLTGNKHISSETKTATGTYNIPEGTKEIVIGGRISDSSTDNSKAFFGQVTLKEGVTTAKMGGSFYSSAGNQGSYQFVLDISAGTLVISALYASDYRTFDINYFG